MKNRKPLTKDQERGMLLQAPAGVLTAYLYDNNLIFEAMDLWMRHHQNSANIEKQMKKLYAQDPRLDEKIQIIDLACRNNSVAGVMRRLLQLHKQGIKVITPNATFTDSMALTEANYLAEDFRMPYQTVVVEIPEGCRGHIRLMRDGFSEKADKLYGQLWNIDMEEMYERGAEARYVILTEVEHDKNYYYKEFGGHAERHIDVEIITAEYLKGEMAKPFDTAKLGGRKSRNPMVFNPAPVSFYGRPLVNGKTVDELISYRAGERDDSPGTIHLPDDDKPLAVDERYTEGSEYEYMIRITRMAMNVVFALTNMGYDEEKKVAAPKLHKRGSRKAQRNIPDVLSATTVMDAELKKIKYDDSVGHSGIVVSPHFRRGHWRRQRHGAGRSMIKNVWIAPIVVNKHMLREGGDQNVFSSSKG